MGSEMCIRDRAWPGATDALFTPAAAPTRQPRSTPPLPSVHAAPARAAGTPRSRGLGRELLRALVRLAGDRGAQRVFLEVRPSNTPALALYHSEGFNEIGRRPRYYPAAQGREDALVMAIELVDDDIQTMPPL